jgi:GT2 family glycosyltransferase
MNISFVLAVYNNLELTVNAYNDLRKKYPNVPLIITSGGSTDGTHEWLKSLTDSNLIFDIEENRRTFSQNFNKGIKLVQTEKLVLIHNDMILGDMFLENIEKHSSPNRLLSYTTIEPSIYSTHIRPGKVILNLGHDFNDFDNTNFNLYVNQHKETCTLYDGASFFMSGYKSLFESVGYFDEFSFIPSFCEDDDFLIRTKLNDFELKTITCAIVYHFVSKTSRSSSSYENELNSNRNFIRKWGAPIKTFQDMKYWVNSDFWGYNPKKIELLKSDFENVPDIEPFFKKIVIDNGYDFGYVKEEQKKTNYDVKGKFIDPIQCDVTIHLIGKLTVSNLDFFSKMQFVLPKYSKGVYKHENLMISIH